MARLARVEFRKALDTRAGRWFIIGILALVVVIEVIYAFAANDDDKNLQDFIQIPGGVLGYFLPIIIIMLVTSEASQRNGLVTFTLEPKRSRVVVAKFIAGLLLAAAVMVLAFVLAILGTLFGILTGSSPEWSVDGNLLFNGFILSNLIGVFVGFAIAMLIMNTAGGDRRLLRLQPDPADRRGHPRARSATPSRTSRPGSSSTPHRRPLFQGDYKPTAEEWAQIATSGTIWLVIPLALGIWRLMRIEFK